MDARIFQDEPMNIRAQMLEIPLAERLSYDAGEEPFLPQFRGAQRAQPGRHRRASSRPWPSV
jgi:hypothetical protein